MFNFFIKLLFSTLIIFLLSSCDPSEDNISVSLTELQKFDSADKGIRFPYYGGANDVGDFNNDDESEDDDKNITENDAVLNSGDDDVRWGRKGTNWHHACASESIQYSLGGKVISAIPYQIKAADYLVQLVVGTSIIAWLESVITSQDGFSDYEFNLMNPSCSALAVAQGAALFAAKTAVSFACKNSPAYDQKKGASSMLKRAKDWAKSSALWSIGLQDAVDAIKFFSYCKAATAQATISTNIAIFICTSSPTGVQCASQTSQATRDGISAGACCSATTAYMAILTATMVTLELKYLAANTHQKKVAVCGHDWYGWRVMTIAQDNDREIKIEKRGAYHSNLDQPSKYNEGDNSKFNHTFYSYKKALLDMYYSGRLNRDIANQQYRELLFGGREIADPTPKSDGGCVMPEISDNILETLYGYKKDDIGYGQKHPAGYSGNSNEFRQRYYFKGSNAEPNFACERFQINDDITNKIPNIMEEDIDKFREAYNCCINRSKSMICLEYLHDYNGRIDDNVYTGLVQPYIYHDKIDNRHEVYIHNDSAIDNNDSSHNAALEANSPMRKNIDFCEVGSFQCSLPSIMGDSINIPVAYEAYQHPLDDKYICARSYSVCPYNFTVGNGTFITGTDINHQNENRPLLSFLSNLGISIASDIRRERNSDGYSDCQYMNHCVIVPGDKEDIEYGLSHDGNDYFISSACTNGRGDSQNYNFNNNLLTRKMETKSITASLAQCLVETFNNLLTNKYGSDAEDGSYTEGEIRNLPSFFDVFQSKLQDILKILLICAVTLMGYRILLVGGVQKKELMPFIIKIAFVMYFVSGSAWKTIFTDGVISIATGISTELITIDGDDIDIYPNAEDFKSLRNVIYNNGYYHANIEVIDINTTNIEGFDKAENDKLFIIKDKPQNGYYFRQNNAIHNISNNNICKFPKYDENPDQYNVNSYPEGKEYLKIFDTLDCMISYALGISVLSSGNSFISAVTMSFMNGFIGMSFALASLFFAISLLAITIKIMSIFILCVIYISILIYVSPITITCILFNKTKQITESWFSSMISYSAQPIFIFMFAGFFISIFNAIIIKDEIRFEHQISKKSPTEIRSESIIDKNSRIPLINCQDWSFDDNNDGIIDGNEERYPSYNSVYCYFNQLYNPGDEKSESLLPGLNVLGMHFYKVGEIIGGVGVVASGAQSNSKFANMLQMAVILYILNFLSTTIANLVGVIINPGGLSDMKGGSSGGIGSVKALFNKTSSYAKTGKQITGGLARRHGEQLYNKANKKIDGITKDPKKKNDSKGSDGGGSF